MNEKLFLAGVACTIIGGVMGYVGVDLTKKGAESLMKANNESFNGHWYGEVKKEDIVSITFGPVMSLCGARYTMTGVLTVLSSFGKSVK